MHALSIRIRLHSWWLRLLVGISLGSIPLPAQEINPVSVERETTRERYWRLVYENDFFTATDRYYTQGILLEFVHPALRRIPVTRLLLQPHDYQLRFGLAYEDDGYTASDLKVAEIRPGDHPYAGTKQLRAYAIAADTSRARRITSGLTLGVIGPAAGGRAIQTFLHRRTGNTIPQGWRNQIRNDVILNYDASVAQRVVRAAETIELVAHVGGRIGTFGTGSQAGATLMLGRLGARRLPVGSGPATDGSEDRGRALFAYVRPALSLTLHDATLQGGLFNRSSPYTISAADITRLGYTQRFGLIYRSGAHYVEYFQTFTSAPFRGGRAHRTGGIVVGWPLGRAARP